MTFSQAKSAARKNPGVSFVYRKEKVLDRVVYFNSESKRFCSSKISIGGKK